MFLLNPSHAQRTFFSRIGKFVDISHTVSKVKKIQFQFIDLDDSKEEQKKDSFTNEIEAKAIGDFLTAFDIDLS